MCNLSSVVVTVDVDAASSVRDTEAVIECPVGKKTHCRGIGTVPK